MADEVYVYGSNLAGRFTSETQHVALRWYRADLGMREGPSGDAYAIALWDQELRPLPYAAIERNVSRFLAYARTKPASSFYVSRFTLEYRETPEPDIAKCFADSPANCRLPGIWQQQLHPSVVKLLLVARWPELSNVDYELFYVWLNKYAAALQATPAGGVCWLADPQANIRLGAWAAKSGVPSHPVTPDGTRYGQHALEMACARLLIECTGMLAMEARVTGLAPMIERARHFGIGTRLIRKHAAAAPKPSSRPAETTPLTHTSPLSQPRPEDLQIYDPAGIYGSTGGAPPVRPARNQPKADEHPFGRILDYVPSAA